MSMNDTDLRNAMARLPKWARTRIENLEHRVAEQARYIEELSTGPEGYSNVRVRDYVYPDRQLGRDVRIAFAIGNPAAGQRSDITVEHSRERPGSLDVHVVSDRSSTELDITPVVSNHIRLSIRRS